LIYHYGVNKEARKHYHLRASIVNGIEKVNPMQQSNRKRNMTENVNYEDNLYFLSRTIDLLDQGARLNLDRELFYEKILDTLFFTDRILQNIFANLTENNYLINRNIYLHSLMKKKKKFTNILSLYIDREQNEWVLEKEIKSKLQRILEIHLADISDIRKTLSLTDDRGEDREIISQNEMNFLMAPGLMEDEEATS
jgi:hypothetical protein